MKLKPKLVRNFLKPKENLLKKNYKILERLRKMEDVLLYSNLKLKLQVRKKKQQKILSVEQCLMILRRWKVLPQTIVKIYWRTRNLVMNTVMIANRGTTPWGNCGLWRTVKIRKQMKYSQHWWKSLKRNKKKVYSVGWKINERCTLQIVQKCMETRKETSPMEVNNHN